MGSEMCIRDSNERVPRWKLDKADWDLFQSLCSTELLPSIFEDTDDPISEFTSIVHSIAERSIPKTSTIPKRFNKPWFTDECKEAIKARKHMLNLFNSSPTLENLNRFRIFRAKARRAIKESKRTTWRNYVSKLNSRTSTKSAWDMAVSYTHLTLPTICSV